jgi:hypothetical protein
VPLFFDGRAMMVEFFARHRVRSLAFYLSLSPRSIFMHEEAPLGMAGIATFADDAMHSAARTHLIYMTRVFVPPYA